MKTENLTPDLGDNGVGILNQACGLGLSIGAGLIGLDVLVEGPRGNFWRFRSSSPEESGKSQSRGVENAQHIGRVALCGRSRAGGGVEYSGGAADD